MNQLAASRSAVPQASMVYITSFVLTSQPRIAAAEALAESALKCGARLCLNLSSAGLLHKVKDSLTNLLPKCSFLFGNRGELRTFGQLLGWSCEDLELTRHLAAMLFPAGMAVVTAGAEATIVATADGDPQLFPVPASLKHIISLIEIYTEFRGTSQKKPRSFQI